MILSFDTFTMQIVSALIMVTFSVTLMLIWAQGRQNESFRWWFVASSIMAFDAIILFFPDIRLHPLLVYVINAFVVIAYHSFSIGFFRFSNLHYDIRMLGAVLLLYSIAASCGYIWNVELENRRMILMFFTVSSFIPAVWAINKLDDKIYKTEKIFLFIMYSCHIIIYALWINKFLDIIPIDLPEILTKVSSVYMVDAFIIIGVILLTLSQVRHRLEREIKKSVTIKKALSTAVRETNVANKSKSIFLANMSHELRTPLNIIIGFSEALKLEFTGDLNQKQTGFVDNIHSGGKRLLNLINDLLRLSNIEAGKLDINLQQTTPYHLVEEHTETLMAVARNYNKTLRIIEDTDTAKYRNVSLMADPVWVKQILVSLVENACKYGKEDGHIWLNCFFPGTGTVRISVKDDGMGIEENQFKNVFKPFNKAGRSHKAIEGTGTGLSIVKGLVTAMNGTIEFDSTVDSGTTIWIDLPLVKSSGNEVADN